MTSNETEISKAKLLKDLIALRRYCKRHYKDVGNSNDFCNGLRSAIDDEIADINLLIHSIKRGEYDK